MGTCYICGKEHVEYRRTVQTGNTYRTGFSSRGSVHSSVASHTGVRTVCANCAFNIDYNQKKSAGAWGPVLGVILILFSLILLLISTGLGIVGIIGGILLCIIPRRNGKIEAQRWYNTNYDKYVDAIDIQIQEKQNRIEQQKNEYQRKIADAYDKEQKKIVEDKKQLEQMGKAFSERLNQEKDLLFTKIQIYNTKFSSIKIKDSESIKKVIKELEDNEVDCEKTLKKISKICDDYIKQCKNSLNDKQVIENSIKQIEKIRNLLLNLINSFIANIKNSENQILKASLEISDNNFYNFKNEEIFVDVEQINKSVLNINVSKTEENSGKDKGKQKQYSSEEEKQKAYMIEYIDEQLGRDDIQEIQKIETMYFNTTSLSYFKNYIPSVSSYISIDEYKKAINEIKKSL